MIEIKTWKQAAYGASACSDSQNDRTIPERKIKTEWLVCSGKVIDPSLNFSSRT